MLFLIQFWLLHEFCRIFKKPKTDHKQLHRLRRYFELNIVKYGTTLVSVVMGSVVALQSAYFKTLWLWEVW